MSARAGGRSGRSSTWSQCLGDTVTHSGSRSISNVPEWGVAYICKVYAEYAPIHLLAYSCIFLLLFLHMSCMYDLLKVHIDGIRCIFTVYL
jgi:hypothetical protein